MKFLKAVLVLFIVVGVGTSYSYAQKGKVGHINTQVLLSMMPEYDTIMEKYNQKYQQLEKEGMFYQQEIEKKQQEYLAGEATFSDTRKAMMQQEIQRLSQQLDEFPQRAQMELQQYVEQLQKPLTEKITAAIEKVAKENGYSHIIDNSSGLLLYSAETHDIMELVKEELGIEQATPSQEDIEPFDMQN